MLQHCIYIKKDTAAASATDGTRVLFFVVPPKTSMYSAAIVNTVEDDLKTNRSVLFIGLELSSPEGNIILDSSRENS